MYHDHRNNQPPIFDVNMFVPGLSVYENIAEGIIRSITAVAGFVVNVATALTRRSQS